MTDTELLGDLLGVNQPWAIGAYQLAGTRLDVWITPWAPRSRSWFAHARPAPIAAGPEAVWRHTNVCGLHCHVHVADADSGRFAGQPWAGDAALPFTRAMGERVFALLAEGVDYVAICKMLGVAFGDVWKYKLALESGRARVSPAAPPIRLAAAPTGSDGVPDATDPVWQGLIEGAVALDIRVLSLKLLLTRLRTQWQVLEDDEVKVAKLRELQRYFVKSSSALGHELSQLRRLR